LRPAKRLQRRVDLIEKYRNRFVLAAVSHITFELYVDPKLSNARRHIGA
jgi:hypothetical protein